MKTVTDLKDGFALINDQFVDKTCEQMTDEELLAFVEQGAWRRNATTHDYTAFAEAARRHLVTTRGQA